MIPTWSLLAALAAGSATGEAAPPVTVVEERVDVVARLAGDGAERARATVLERADLDALPAETLAEALVDAGALVVLFPHPFGGVPMIVARGFFGGGETDYLTLDAGGLPLGDVESGAIDWQAVRLSDVGRIELLAGPASRGAGELALAGATSLSPRVAGAEPEGAVEISSASFGTHSAGLRWLGSFRAGAEEPEPWNAAFAVDGFETAGYREHSAARASGASARLEGAVGGGRLSAAVLVRERDREEPGPLSELELARDPLASNAMFADDLEAVERSAAHAGWSGERLPLELRVGRERRDASFRRTLLLAEDFGDGKRRETDAEALTVALRTARAMPAGATLAWQTAFEARSENADTRYFELGEAARPLADESVRRERWALELSAAWRPASSFELSTTLRGDRIDDRARHGGDRRDEAFSPRFALVWSPARLAGLELVAEVGRAFRAPTLDQRYDPRPFPLPDGGSFTISSPALEPQRSRSWEVGARRAGRSSRFKLLAYRMILADEIDFDPATFRYANLARSRHEGVEAELAWRFASGAELAGSGALARAFTEGISRSGQLKNVPRHLVRLRWTSPARAPVGFALRVTALDGRYADDANRRSLGDRVVADARLSRDLGPVRLRLDLLNLLDDDALELGFLLPGADGADTLFGFAPAPRAVRLGLEWLW
jgi:outer membrane receptor protein involved in Fe transport